MKIANVEKKSVDKLVEQYTENIDGNQMIYNATLNSHRKVCNCCTTSIVLLAIASLIIIGIRSAFFFSLVLMLILILILILRLGQ